MGITGAFVSAGVALYNQSEQSKLAKEQEAAQKAAIDAAKPPPLPNTQSLATSLQQGDEQARSAGGTILSQPRQLGDNAGVGRKTLLGQ